MSDCFLIINVNKTNIASEKQVDISMLHGFALISLRSSSMKWLKHSHVLSLHFLHFRRIYPKDSRCFWRK